MDARARIGASAVGLAVGLHSLFLSVPAVASAAPRMSTGAAAVLQSALDKGRRETGTPGAAAAIVIDDKVAWLGQSGTVDTRTGEPVRPATMFSLASVSKMFVAVVLMRLAQEGRLKLSDPISLYVPSYVPDADRVTVGELLDHTSGYRDDEDDAAMLRLLADPNYPWTRDAVMRRQRSAQRTPGSHFDYCNSCYVMLGAVIEKASGASVGENLQRFVIAPLGLQDEVDIDRVASFVPRIARGYDLEHKKLIDTFVSARSLGVPTGVWGPVWTDGGVIATASGVARFTDALFSGRLLDAASMDRLLHPPTPGIALESVRFDGVTWRGHSGFYVGFTAESRFDAARHVTIVVLANRTDDADPATEIWNRLTLAFDRLHR